MTAQAHDMVTFDGTEWALVGIEGHGLFDPVAWDLRPIALSTAEWRGFVCRYAVQDGRLRLAHLSIGLSEEDAASAIGRLPGVTGSAGDRLRRELDFVGFEVPFTGTLLLGQGFIRDLYVHMGFHPAWKWERVVRLGIDAGVVGATADLSAQMAGQRQRHEGEPLSPGPGADRDTIGRWIREAFDRSIRRRRGSEEPGRKESPRGH